MVMRESGVSGLVVAMAAVGDATAVVAGALEVQEVRVVIMEDNPVAPESMG